jgi:hypothetical protein
MMHGKIARFGIVAVLAFSLSATGRLVAQTTGGADQAVKDVVTGLADGKPVVLWQALPSSYQKDVKSLIGDLANKLDVEVYNKAFAVSRKGVKLLKDKKDFILASDATADIPQTVNKKQLTEVYDALVGILDTFVTSDLGKLDELKKADVEKFLAVTAPKLGGQFSTIVNFAETVNPKDPNFKKFHDGVANMKNIKVTVVKAAATETTLKIDLPGETEKKEVVFVKVEGKWVPKELADTWADDMKKAKAALEQIPPIKEEIKKEVLGFLDMADKKIDELANTKTQKDFNEKAKDIIGSRATKTFKPINKP